MTEYKQVREGDDIGERTSPRGQLKGSKGLTKAQREAARELTEAEESAEFDRQIIETTNWLNEHADHKKLGTRETKLLVKLQAAAQTASGFITRLIESRKGNTGGEQ